MSRLNKLNTLIDACHTFFLILFQYLHSKKTVMTFITSQPATSYRSYSDTKRKTLFSKFNDWAAAEEAEFHIAWVGTAVISMAAVFFPLTMTVVLFNGASFGLIIAAMASLTLVVITNLAAMPVKFTIPFFVLGVLADVVIIFTSFFIK
jgi:hypothetical protein